MLTAVSWQPKFGCSLAQLTQSQDCMELQWNTSGISTIGYRAFVSGPDAVTWQPKCVTYTVSSTAAFT